MKITTKLGVEESVDDPRWQAPAHQVSIEVDTHGGGVRRRSVAGVRSPKLDHSHVKGVLTDRQIARYIREGFYEARGEYLKRKKEDSALKRLIYDPEKGDFV